MAYIINADECQSCGACKSDCPTSCISMQNGSYAIDANVCVDCGTCLNSCGFGAISAE